MARQIGLKNDERAYSSAERHRTMAAGALDTSQFETGVIVSEVMQNTIGDGQQAPGLH